MCADKYKVAFSVKGTGIPTEIDYENAHFSSKENVLAEGKHSWCLEAYDSYSKFPTTHGPF